MLHRTFHPRTQQGMQSSTKGGCYVKHSSPEELSAYLRAKFTGCRNMANKPQSLGSFYLSAWLRTIKITHSELENTGILCEGCIML